MSDQTNSKEASARYAEALYALAFQKIEQKCPTDAAYVLRLMLHLTPKDERIWIALGVCHEQLGQLQIARELYAMGSLAAAPSPRCLIALARGLREENTDAAILHYEKAAELAGVAGDERIRDTARRELRGLQ
jgi:tetratricopeptide (TPR) repeat protein